MRRNLNVNEIASLGSNVKPVIQNENCSILMLNDATGEGVMTIYRVLPGVMICFSDMHMEQCVSEFELKNDRKIFCIDHCREGRIEMEVKPGVFSIMQENELAVKQAIGNLIKREKTVIMIAHTLSIIKNADQILVVSGGQIIESGKHEELLKKGSKYAAMWKAEQELSA